MKNNISVMLSTEGTYPFHQGGVSTWCELLVNNLKDNMDFVVYSIIMNPYVTQKFSLPPNGKLIKVPLWGTEDPNEHLDKSFSEIYFSKKATTQKIIKEKFIPLFSELIKEFISKEKNPVLLGEILTELHEYFQTYEYKNTFKSELTWNTYKSLLLKSDFFENSNLYKTGVFSTIQSLGWIYRFLTILNTPVPEVDVAHSAAAAFCGIPCVLSKIKNKTPYILTEHGVYLREQYLYLSKRGYPSFLSFFLIRMLYSVVSLSYEYADQISPVCEYNTRWEKFFAPSKEKIKVIYNGVDNKIFVPATVQRTKKYISVISVARIDPIKDIITFIKSAHMVIKECKDVKFFVYGSVTVPEYYEECLKLRKELNIEDKFIFAGHTNNVQAAYGSGDIVVLSSISEGFPYSVLEAMMMAKPVIATDVGGISEALGNSGILVTPRNERQLAEAMLLLIKNPELRNKMSEDGRDRALNQFTLKKVQELYEESYIKLAKEKRAAEQKSAKEIGKEQIFSLRDHLEQRKVSKLDIDKAFALIETGCYEDAAKFIKKVLKENIDSPVFPVLLTMAAEAYYDLGEYDKAFNELDKAEAISQLRGVMYEK